MISYWSVYFESDGEEGSVLKEDVIVLYQDLMQFVQDDEFDKNIRKELEKAFPNSIRLLEMRKKDMKKTDHGIVIAGKMSL